jgi:hypothetical protein
LAVSLCPQDLFCPSAGTGRYRQMPVCRPGLASRPSSNTSIINTSEDRDKDKDRTAEAAGMAALKSNLVDNWSIGGEGQKGPQKRKFRTR